MQGRGKLSGQRKVGLGDLLLRGDTVVQEGHLGVQLGGPRRPGMGTKLTAVKESTVGQGDSSCLAV